MPTESLIVSVLVTCIFLLFMAVLAYAYRVTNRK